MVMNAHAWQGIAFALLLSASMANAATPQPKSAVKAAAKPDCVAVRGKSPIKIESRCMRLDFNGVTRTYRLYKPKELSKSPMALLLALHGGDDSGSGMEALTLGQFNRLADTQRAIVVYPDGVNRNWNDARANTRTATAVDEVNDVEFLRALIAHIATQYAINPGRIYATGIANGGLMAFRLACDAADVFAAVATVAANFPVELARNCQPSRMISIAMVNGTDDPMMPWLGGDINVLGTRRGEVLSTQDTFEQWNHIGDCAIPITHMERDRVADDGTSLVRHVAHECKNNSEVRLYEILGGGHTWPSGYAYRGPRIIGKVSRELQASDELWRFFAEHGR
jgi:polyhydroxybutyrate depolymerase